MMCSHPGSTAEAISLAAGASADHRSRKLT
jgi:hypothetical protein